MVHYIAGYVDSRHVQDRKCSLAGIAKMDYVISCLASITAYEVYATTQTKKQVRMKRTKNVQYRLSVPSTNRYGFYFDRFLGIVQLIIYLLRVPRKDTVLVYHERWYVPWVQLIHKVKKWKLAYEVEEIYLAVANHPASEINKEISQVTQADSYILSTVSLKDMLFLKETDVYAVCNGVYMPLYPGKKVENEKTHIVYAGSLNPAKGAWLAIEAMKYLPASFVLHVSGAGSEKDLATIHKLIAESNGNNNIIFEGCLSESDHLALLQKCDIGLCPANPRAAFPSKILEYMRNSLKVVSVKKSEIEQAQCAKYLFFFEDGNMEDYCKQVMKAAQTSDQDASQCMSQMHNQFLTELKAII